MTVNDVRLVGGLTSSVGRVEVLINGIWGRICDNDWTIQNARVVCHQLNYMYTLSAPIGSVFGEGKLIVYC